MIDYFGELVCFHDKLSIKHGDDVPNMRWRGIILKMSENSSISIKDLAGLFTDNEKTIKRDIEKLKKNGTIKRELDLKGWGIVRF